MQKVDERVDLSRQVLSVDIGSPVFEPILDSLNEKIIEVLKKVYNGEFESGDITLKLILAVPELEKGFQTENGLGEPPTVKFYRYKALSCKHSITTTLKKVDKDEGTYYGEKELKEDDYGNFVEQPIEDPQLSMFD